MGEISAKKISVDSDVIERSCLSADETIDKLTLIVKEIVEANDALVYDLVGEMHSNYSNASVYLEDKVIRARNFIQRTNDDARWEVEAIKKVEQEMNDMIGGPQNG